MSIHLNRTTMTTALLLSSVLSAALPLSSMASEQGSQGLLNNALPLPDSYLMQSLKPVVIQLKGHVSVSKHPAPPADEKQAAGEPVAPPPVAKATATPATAAPSAGAAPADVAPLNPLSQRLVELTDQAQTNNEELQKYTAAVDKYGDWKQRVVERSRDMLNYSLLFKGVSPSSEGGDVILNEKSKVKGLAAAKYLKQKLADGVELDLVSAVMELAMGIGNNDSGAGQTQISQASAQLNKLVGAAQTEQTVAFLKGLQAQDRAPMPVVTKPLWSISDAKTLVEQIITAAAGNDKVVADITADVHHYNQHSTGTMAAHRIARTTLSAASMTPNFVGPAAQVILFSYITVSGGTEQEKLLRELYIDKRLSSRANLLGEQAHMALYNYQLGALTQNRLLQNCSHQLLERLAGQAGTKQVLTPSPGAPSS